MRAAVCGVSCLKTGFLGWFSWWKFLLCHDDVMASRAMVRCPGGKQRQACFLLSGLISGEQAVAEALQMTKEMLAHVQVRSLRLLPQSCVQRLQCNAMLAS